MSPTNSHTTHPLTPLIPHHPPTYAGMFQLVRVEDRLSTSGGMSGLQRTGPSSSKLRTQQRYCFLFSKHLIITARNKKPSDSYKAVKVSRVE